MGTPAHKPTTQKMNCIVTISHMSKEEIAVRYGVPKSPPKKPVRSPILAKLKAALPSRREPALKDTIAILQKIIEFKPMNRDGMMVVDMVADLYFQGMGYEEALRVAKEWRRNQNAKPNKI